MSDWELDMIDEIGDTIVDDDDDYDWEDANLTEECAASYKDYISSYIY